MKKQYLKKIQEKQVENQFNTNATVRIQMEMDEDQVNFFVNTLFHSLHATQRFLEESVE